MFHSIAIFFRQHPRLGYPEILRRGPSVLVQGVSPAFPLQQCFPFTAELFPSFKFSMCNSSRGLGFPLHSSQWLRTPTPTFPPKHILPYFYVFHFPATFCCSRSVTGRALRSGGPLDEGELLRLGIFLCPRVHEQTSTTSSSQRISLVTVHPNHTHIPGLFTLEAAA